jgi:hypothetical protein
MGALANHFYNRNEGFVRHRSPPCGTFIFNMALRFCYDLSGMGWEQDAKDLCYDDIEIISAGAAHHGAFYC